MSDLRYWWKLDDIPAGVPFENADENAYIFVEPGNGVRSLRNYDADTGAVIDIADPEWTAPDDDCVQDWPPFLELPPPPKTDVELIVEYINDSADGYEESSTSVVSELGEKFTYAAKQFRQLARQIKSGDWKPDGYTNRGC